MSEDFDTIKSEEVEGVIVDGQVVLNEEGAVNELGEQIRILPPVTGGSANFNESGEVTETKEIKTPVIDKLVKKIPKINDFWDIIEFTGTLLIFCYLLALPAFLIVQWMLLRYIDSVFQAQGSIDYFLILFINAILLLVIFIWIIGLAMVGLRTLKRAGEFAEKLKKLE